MKIAVLGSGNMGGALIKGWAKAAKANDNILCGTPAEVTITAHTQATLDRFQKEYPQIKTTLSNPKAVKGADVVVLAVKPWLIEQVLKEVTPSLDFSKQIVVSVAANVTTDKLASIISSASQQPVAPQLCYAMPNIAAEFGESMTFLSKTLSDEAMQKVNDLFSVVGKTQVCEERLIGAGMMMAGCGIAYVMRFIRAMMEGGVEMGFYPKDSQQIAMQTMQGAITLLAETGLHPEAAIDKVTTPGGTTIKGLNELDHAGFNSAVIRCLKSGLK